ncbi:MAG: hypothetical protein M3R36_11040 [Bacteroidota bacterium]|nr:hypothetical protein [Bacteroidota bacterium]
MLKFLFLGLFLSFVIFSGCSNDDDNPVNPPVTGEVLLATVSGDSVGTSGSGLSTRTSSITSSTLNFTDRDSARITFFYSGENNNIPIPMSIYYISDTTEINIFSSTTLNPTPAEQFVNVTVPSPRVNATFRYKIVTGSLGGPSFFKFRELNIYKK